MRKEEVIKKAIKEIRDKVHGDCPADPAFSACNIDYVYETLRWALGEIDEVTIQTFWITWKLDKNGNIKKIEEK